jgi:hypothetical protein
MFGSIVEMEPLIEDRLIVEVQRRPAGVVSSRTLEGTASINFKHIVTAASLIDPSADGVNQERSPRRPWANGAVG